MNNEQVSQNGSRNGNKSTESTLDELMSLINKSLTQDFIAGEMMGEIKSFLMLVEMIEKEIITMMEIPGFSKLKVELLLVMFDLEKVANRLVVIGKSMVSKEVSDAMEKMIKIIKSETNKDE